MEQEKKQINEDKRLDNLLEGITRALGGLLRHYKENESAFNTLNRWEKRLVILSPTAMGSLNPSYICEDGKEYRSMEEDRLVIYNKDYWENWRKNGEVLSVLGRQTPLLIIAGQTHIQEETVNSIKDLGFIVARYSRFYGGNSPYTKKSPENAGYSIDIPIKQGLLRKLLESEDIYEAINSRNQDRIEESIKEFNNKYYSLNKINITPFLKEALKIDITKTDKSPTEEAQK